MRGLFRFGGRFNSIKTSMVLSFMVLISMIVLFLSLLSYRYTVNDIESISINYTVRLLNEINSSIDSYIGNMKSMGQVVVENKDVRDLMSFYNDHHGEILSEYDKQSLAVLQANAASHMNVVASTREEITNIAVISKYQDVVLSDAQKMVNPYSEFNLREWFLKPLSYKEDILVSPSHVQNLIAGEYKWVISISKAITDSRTGDITGVMVIDLNYQAIEKICENAQLGSSGYIYLLDSQRNIIYHPQQQLLYSGTKTELVDEVLYLSPDQSYLREEALGKIYTKNFSQITGWSAVGVVNTNELIKNKDSIISYYAFLAILAILFATVIAILISTTITRPIKMLENTMHKVEEGDFNIQSKIELNNEIGHLSKTFNVMISKIKLLMQSAVSIEEEKRRSEIRALQAQINPHFLYNTLETIIWMSASGKNEEVVEVTSALAKLFRTSISKGDNLVPLAVEVENINSYLTIQKMRYKDKLTFSVEIDPQLLGMMTPKLILQPIVENALYHGIKQRDEGGFIRISGVLCGDRLTLAVEDDGMGMNAQQIRHLFTPKNNTDRGIGVINVNNRIKLCFGEEYGLFYYSNIGKGTRVEICLPAIREEEPIDD